MKYYVTTFYKFIPFKQEQLKSERDHWVKFCKPLGIRGLFLLATEGLNSTLCAPSLESFNKLKTELKSRLGFSDQEFKDSESHKMIFRILKVAIRKEIVTLHMPEFDPLAHDPKFLTAEEWHETLKNEDVICVDTRNWYENEMGMFKNAIDLKIDEFTQFGEQFEKLNVPKDKKVLIYCTGGIRCEKGFFELQKRGYEKVYQLKDGILRYIEKFPNQLFEGECFVFDERVAVDQNLEPSKKYAFCPHCGQPAKNIEDCKRCDSPFKICDKCQSDPHIDGLCSKNCVYQFHRFPDVKGKKQLQGYKALKQNAYILR